MLCWIITITAFTSGVELDSLDELRSRMLNSVKEGIKSAYESEEFALMQASNAFRELSKSYNLAYERLSEWYGIYFPEIKLSNPKSLAQLAIALNSNPPDREAIAKVIEDPSKVDDVYSKASATIGRKMGAEERDALVKFAELSLSMEVATEQLKAYIKAASTRMLPNTSYLTDETIAAELLSKAGSLDKLATMPASTIQLLGAEKALFKHIKFGSKPPKYGILFKLPAIGTAPKYMRGRIARAYATKISIGLKGDVYSKRFIGEALKKSLDSAVERIKSSPEPEQKPWKPERPAMRYNGGTRRGNYRGGGGRRNNNRRPRN
jgi:nucleolar protein 56